MKKIAALILILGLFSNNLRAMETVIRPAVQSLLYLGVDHPKTAAVVSLASSAASVYCWEKAMTSDSLLVTAGGVGASFALSIGAITVCPAKNSLNGIVTGTLLFSTFASNLYQNRVRPLHNFLLIPYAQLCLITQLSK